MSIEQITAVVESFPEVQLAVLFGSCARGVDRAGSDIDLGLRFDPVEGPRWAIEAALGRAAGRTVDIVILDECPPLLRFEIARDGLVLCERRPYAWADFKARAMVDWWDWQVFARIMTDACLQRLREG